MESVTSVAFFLHLFLYFLMCIHKHLRGLPSLPSAPHHGFCWKSDKVTFTTVNFINLKYKQLKRSGFRQQGGPWVPQSSVAFMHWTFNYFFSLFSCACCFMWVHGSDEMSNIGRKWAVGVKWTEAQCFSAHPFQSFWLIMTLLGLQLFYVISQWQESWSLKIWVLRVGENFALERVCHLSFDLQKVSLQRSVLGRCWEHGSVLSIINP